MVQLSKEYIEVSRTEMPEHLVSNYIVELPPAWRNTERTANLAKGPLQRKVDLRLTNTQPLTEDRGSAGRSCGARGTGSLMYSLNNTDTGLRTVSECCTADSFSGQGGDKFSKVRSIVLVGPISLFSSGARVHPGGERQQEGEEAALSHPAAAAAGDRRRSSGDEIMS